MKIPNNVTRAFYKVGFTLKKHSPEILLTAGIVGGVASAVMACKATTKVSAILENTKEQVDGIHSVLENPELGQKYVAEYGEEYTVEESKKDLAIVYAQTGIQFAKVYGPAILLGLASISCVLASNNIMRKRNVALAAAYTAVDQGFKEYRNRVIERFGDQLDKELKYNIKSKEIEEVVVNEDGSEQTVTKTVQCIDPNHRSPYTRCFDEYCTGWSKDAEFNKMFLINQQNVANNMLQAKGHLYLNEVFELLGMDKTKAGHVVGWVYDEKNPIGDNYVDFGLFNLEDEACRDFINGREKSVWLDFNVDGNVWELMS